MGVREAVVLAIRAAANAVQRELTHLGIEALAGTAETHEELHRAMTEAERGAPLQWPARLPTDSPHAVDTPAPPPFAFDGASAVVGLERPGISDVHELRMRPTSRPPSMELVRAFEPPAPAPGEMPPMASVRLPMPGAPPWIPNVPPDVPTTAAGSPTRAPLASNSAPATLDEPPFPGPDVASGFIWPAATGRDTLRRLALSADRIRRDDLIAQHGHGDGSGTSDTVIYESGLWCLKTSRRRRFIDADEARTSLLRLARKKMQLGELLPPNTVLSVQLAPNGSLWLWTVAPWLSTLRAVMGHADRTGDEAALTDALAAFARAVGLGLALTARHAIVLDVHPSNFGILGDQIYYLDDDIGSGSTYPAVGHALLRRVVEYAHRPAVIEAYLVALEAALRAQLSPDELERLGVALALDEAIVRTRIAHEARIRLAAALQQPRARSAQP
jgi:hypothetical protein